MNKYQYILWDVDGTLLDFSYSQKTSLFKCLARIGVEGTDELNSIYSVINDKWWKNLELGVVTKQQLLCGRFAEFFETCHIECADIESFRQQFQHELSVNFKEIEDSVNVCKKLQELGFHQYVVTNGVSSTQRTKLKLSGFDSFMEELFISEEIGFPKPKKEFFDMCFSKIKDMHSDFLPKETLIIGDSMSSDMKGGINAGIDTCYFAPNATTIEENVTYQIVRLTEVLSILGVS